MSSFQDLGVFVHNNPEAEAQRSYAHALSLSCNSTIFVLTESSDEILKVYDVKLQKYQTNKQTDRQTRQIYI